LFATVTVIVPDDREAPVDTFVVASLKAQEVISVHPLVPIGGNAEEELTK
jgi:hypothetical protein